MKPYNFDQSPKARLEYYKARSTKVKANYPQAVESFYIWRNKSNRYPKPAFLKTSPLSRSEDGTKLYLDNLDQWPCSDYQDAHDVAKLDHTGWYADNFQNELIRAAVVSFRNPHKVNDEYEDENTWYVDNPRSHIFYLPAIYYTDADMASVYINEVYTDKREAARAADHYAERLAEDEREGDAQFLAEQQIEEAKAELHTLNRETLQVIRELKQNSTIDLFDGKTALCRVIREHIEEAIERRTELFDKIAELKDDPWTAVNTY